MALTKSSATLFDYRNPLVKKAIWALKYKHKKMLGKYFGTALYREFFKHLAYAKNGPREDIILIPIPSSAKGKALRGYNHAAIIAKTISLCAKDDGLELTLRTDLLYKKRESEQQARVGKRTDRQENVDDVFGLLHPEVIQGKSVILIDDVITTGATIKDAQRAVRGAKPKRVLAIAVAH